MTDRTQVRRRISPLRMIGRFALALLAIIISGSLSNAGVVGAIPDLFALFALALLVWAIVGLFPHKVQRYTPPTQ